MDTQFLTHCIFGSFVSTPAARKLIRPMPSEEVCFQNLSKIFGGFASALSQLFHRNDTKKSGNFTKMRIEDTD